MRTRPRQTYQWLSRTAGSESFNNDTISVGQSHEGSALFADQSRLHENEAAKKDRALSSPVHVLNSSADYFLTFPFLEMGLRQETQHKLGINSRPALASWDCTSSPADDLPRRRGPEAAPRCTWQRTVCIPRGVGLRSLRYYGIPEVRNPRQTPGGCS